MKTISVALVVCILAFPAFADGPPDLRKVVIDGNEFVAFTPKDAQALLDLRLKFPGYKSKMLNLEKQIANKTNQISNLELSNSNLLEQKSALSEHVANLELEIERQDAWYKSPYLWFAVGLALGTTGTIAVVYLVK
jgi:hypothetical protein